MKGLGVSPGIVMGQVYVDWKEQIEVEKDFVDDVDNEIERLNLAVATAGEEINQLYQTPAVLDKDEAGPDLYRVHGIMLKDPEFIGQIKDKIITESVNAEWAVKKTAEKFVQVFENLGSEDLKARADDVKDVSARVCRLLLHIEGNDLFKDEREGLILVCRSLGTAEMTLIQKHNIAGIVCEEGTIGSHAVIMARNQNKPAVVGIQGIASDVYHGDFIIVDGNKGDVIVNPDEETIVQYEKLQQEERRFAEELKNYIGRPVRTEDGETLKVFGNAASDSDIESIMEVDGRGVGLYRTEYIYLNLDRLPTEGEQFWEYKKTVLAMKGRPVVFRTLDIGGDKIPSYLEMPEEQNPALGHRAIRYSLSRADIFRVQIKAMLRASAYGNVSILLPLITAVEEVRAAKALIEDVKEELRKEDIAFNPAAPVGIVVETPSAALISDLLAQECDFLSIGSNDLIQYTLAVDRLAPALADLYSPFAPAVLRLVRHVITCGRAAGKPVSLCGEMAGEPLLSPLLLGMGLKIFSVNPSEILRTQWILSSLTMSEMEQCAQEVLSLSTEQEIRRYCTERFSQFASNRFAPEQEN
ncbi:MAG: phosphoenolpyruvate--protein phosphotransferase [Pyramidobacter sp.]|nr:phosphoenolpyruvate--protein phosphotransferase [Pyramidobacter sp.]